MGSCKSREEGAIGANDRKGTSSALWPGECESDWPEGESCLVVKLLPGFPAAGLEQLPAGVLRTGLRGVLGLFFLIFILFLVLRFLYGFPNLPQQHLLRREEVCPTLPIENSWCGGEGSKGCTVTGEEFIVPLKRLEKKN